MNESYSLQLHDAALMFVQLFSELTILFLLISFGVALINQRLPAEKIQRLLGAKQGKGYFLAAGLGAVTPFCSCSTIPMLVGLLKARAGFGATMTFLFTSPLLNPIVIVLFIPVLGWKVTVLYAMLALTVSLSAGVLLQRFGFERYVKQELLQPAAPTACCGEPEASSSCSAEAVNNDDCCETVSKKEPTQYQLAWQETWSLFKSMFPYMLIAMIIGALVHGFVPTSFFAEVAGADNPAAVPAAALIGIPLYMRVTALLPLVAPLLAKGVSMGAVIALVIGSGGASLPELILLKRLFRWQLLVAFLVVIFSMAVLGGYLFNLILG